MGRRGRESPTHDLGLCRRIRAESVGRPGKRRFRLHAYAEHGTALLWMEKEQLYEGRDLNLTTDFRDVLGELVVGHLGNPDLKTVFPGYAGGPEKFRGLIRA